ncbi:S8 family peptidase [Leptospira noguchii]|uniref:S8 family peptidase n=3 Tax=Leptospira noguchii TaxID=28182 RepID=A0AAE9GBA3_9LEPT|nr:S8 family peptidase [Leptospira noguchii]EMN02692.1 peptidase, S8/S53 family [Leptospira noguchii str. 2007001578]MCH1911314.1 S8 family peptidase [Leptospira noguchii]MCH1914351.1 S8 family peptidase [Leptospira noguchii]UOG30807.1 S8 family peptidase [Leptospira noguchii]UOG52946.1 S8 family peptidase [Leptospira noguchii]
MPDFPHLKLQADLTGFYRSPKVNGGNEQNERTKNNLQNRSEHGGKISKRISDLQKSWIELLKSREDLGLPPLPDAIPLFLETDPDNFNVDSLRSFGIEVLSVEEDGLVIGASTDGYDFKSLKEKIEKFLTEQGKYKNTAAKLWDIETGNKWRIDQILSSELQEKWSDLEDDREYIADISVSCNVYIPELLTKNDEISDREYAQYVEGWRTRKSALEKERDEKAVEREKQLEEFVIGYNGKYLSSIIDTFDSFGVRIQISGKGLKDIVFNFPFVFEVSEYDPYLIEYGAEEEGEISDLSFMEPNEIAPIICVIDSGIQEEHKYIANAIRRDLSKSYIPYDDSTFDDVENGGHGTRVTGAILFGNAIPRNGIYQHSTWIANARVLDSNNGMPFDLYPPELIRKIVSDYHHNCKIYNLSISSKRSCRTRHMSVWAAAIDSLCWEKDTLFIISTGNIRITERNQNNPGVKEFVARGKHYPDYFQESSNRIANPAQSAFSLSVGSICNSHFEDHQWKSFGQKDDPSAFTRRGPGLWGMIKPDVVEYGGDYVHEKNALANIATRLETTPETIRTTTDAQGAIGKDSVGTSFSTPKVTHIVAQILARWPNATSLFIRSLIAQSARWPAINVNLSEYQKLSLMGYGLPSLDRSLDNAPNRITFVAEGFIRPKHAHVYKVMIPEELRSPGDSYSYLIEVSLTYKARVRRTRRGTKSYVSSWVDWLSSKLGEKDEVFKSRAVQYATDTTNIAEDDSDVRTIKWTIRERNNLGNIKNLKRNDSTLQKDWVILPSYDLPEHLSFAVVGHAGWERDILLEEAPYCLLISIECLNTEIEIYERIKVHNQIEIEV